MTDKIAIIGCGAIGRPWAIAFARAGREAGLWARDRAKLDAALGLIERQLDDLAKADLLDGQSPAAVRARIRPETDLAAALDGAVHVQENLPDRIAVKSAMFLRLDGLAAADVPIASSTSGIPPSAFTAEVKGRGRCLVAHPVNPPHLVPVVELVPAPWTDPAAVARTRALMAAIGQVPVLVERETPGFILNRLQGAVLNEAFRLVADGFASPRDVDAAIKHGLGLRWALMGPFETVDLNCPGGIREFADSFRAMFAEVARLQADAQPWPEAAVAAVEDERRRALPLADIAARQAWRDRRLMALIGHRRRAARELGA